MTVLIAACSAPGADLARALNVPSPQAIGLPLRGALVFLALLPAVGTSLALEALRRSARATSEGRGLTLDVALELRGASSWMLASSLSALVVPSLAGALLSIASGRLTLTVHVDSGVVMPLVLATALRLVSSLVIQAAGIAEEHAQIV